MIANVKGYSFDTRAGSDSTNGIWYKATKDGKQFFLKKFKEPKYPHIEGTDPDGSKKAECKEWYSMRNRVLEALRELGNGSGNCRFPIEFFREKASYYQVSHWVDIKSASVKDIAKLSDSEKLFIMRTYSAALSRVHRVNIIHGDIKPDNVLIDRAESGKRVAKLIDFDDSYFSKEALRPDLTKSTEYYKSPELAAYIVTNPDKEPEKHRELRSRLTCATDVFASGLMFHEFWTGSMPNYVGRGTDKAFYKAVTARESYEYDQRIPEWLVELIDDMVQREPEKRPTMNEVFDAIKLESYSKKNPWQNTGEVVKINFSKLKKLMLSIPNDLDLYEPETAVEKINIVCGYIKQNMKTMSQEEVDVLTSRLDVEVNHLRKKHNSMPAGEMILVSSFPNGIKEAEIISNNLVKIMMNDGRKTFKTKEQAYKMGVVKIE